MWFVIVAIDALPLQDGLRNRIDPLLDKTGLWQGTWTLFAPEPDKINVRVAATVLFEDGRVATWRSPEWQELGPVERFLRFREMEYIDGIRVDANAGAWDAFARYTAAQVPHPDGRRSAVRQVSLRRYWATIPPPSSGILPSEPYLYFTGSATYHVWSPAGSGG